MKWPLIRKDNSTYHYFHFPINSIGDVMLSVLALRVVDRGFEHAALRRKSKDWLARNQNNVSEWSDMSTRELLFHKRLVLSHSHLFLLCLTTHNHSNKNVSVKVMQIHTIALNF
jgi:hypothetical protein